ncbi:DeoR/GlpR family DNA-binding transcription regulator [Psychromonas algicola]|uniref:DeoR/GlpR family DNA-binding transcription regulator n=1 Tax=Psychromonas algicola TaxID=2555642 RepID=UPI001FBB4D55|nr:DeoR/GlpR family DNA-binding transcription regulator [Psychromonas sp. RZ5]
MHKMTQQLSLRQQAILDMLQVQEYCSVETLALHFDVTTQTIRRNINELCSMGLASRHHGGAGLPVTLMNRSYASRKISNQDEKEVIAQQVAKQIPDGCTLFLGIGTTIATIAEKITNRQELRVLTNNLEAAYILSQYDNIETWVPGGKIRTNDRDIVSDAINQFYGQFTADIGIIGCASIASIAKPTRLNEGYYEETELSGEANSEEYVFEHESREATVSQAIINGSQQKWLVANSAKWQRKANAKVAPLSFFDQIFTANTMSK